MQTSQLGDQIPGAPLIPIPDLLAPEGGHTIVLDGEVRLRGSQCRRCATAAFPVRRVCMACGNRELDEVLLPGEGSLYSFTTVEVSSSRQVPYMIGYVDLDNG